MFVFWQVRKVLAEFDPDFEGIGLDESFLDLTEFVAKRQSENKTHRVAIVRPLPEKNSGCKSFVWPPPTGADSLPGSETQGSLSADQVKKDDAVTSMAHLDCEDVSVECACPAEDVERKAAFHGGIDEDGDLTLGQHTLEAPNCGQAMNVGDSSPQEETQACIESGVFESFGNSVEEVVRELRFRVYQATGLTLSAGIGANRRLAKICSDRNKPNGQYLLPNNRDAIVAFMTDLPIRKVVNRVFAPSVLHV